MSTRSTLSLGLAVLLALAVVPAARADRCPCGDLVLPYFEVQLSEVTDPALYQKATVVFAVGNSHDAAIDVVLSVWTNWGIQVLETYVTIPARSIYPVNLRDWLLFGRLPEGDLPQDELAHVQAALCGEPSPRDGLYYATAVGERLATGYVLARALTTPLNPQQHALWGDFFTLDPSQHWATGESLVRLVANATREVCNRHLIRFLRGGAFDAGTEFVFWTGSAGIPSAEPTPAFYRQNAHCRVYSEGGMLIAESDLPLQATQAIDVAGLGWPMEFGWVDCTTETLSFVCVSHSAAGHDSLVLRSYCEPKESGSEGEGAAIDLEKLTLGQNADGPPGPMVPPGAAVDWTYVVTNTGDLALSEIAVTDDREAEVTCPKDSLEPGESMTCTASGTVGAGQYENTGLVVARTPEGSVVSDRDPSHCFGIDGRIELSKATNGADADQPPGPTLTPGTAVVWTYVVTNTGNVPLSAVAVSDDRLGAIVCPKSTLATGESMTCTAGGVAAAGAYTNLGTVVATTPDGSVVDHSDPSHYFGMAAEIDLEKATNGVDADQPPGVAIPVGATVTWTYVVTNTGNLSLTGVAVTDDQLGAIACPKTTLAPGESMTCSESGLMPATPYSNLGTAVGVVADGRSVQDQDPSFCHPAGEPAIGLEKATNGVDADQPPGVAVPVGATVTWTYVVTNTGNLPLTGVTVTDDQLGAIVCPKTTLAPGESMTCSESGVVGEGPYANLGTAAGTAPDGSVVSASDPSHCVGTPAGDEGCTPGYWKNHTGSWAPAGYAPAQTVRGVFASAAAYPSLASASLLSALDFGGGPGTEGAAAILLRAGVAALLNAAHPDVAYPLGAVEVVAQVDAALASGDRDTMLLAASQLDALNNLGCPLS